MCFEILSGSACATVLGFQTKRLVLTIALGLRVDLNEDCFFRFISVLSQNLGISRFVLTGKHQNFGEILKKNSPLRLTLRASLLREQMGGTSCYVDSNLKGIINP